MNLRWMLLVCACVLTGGAVASADDWPQWHGPDRTNVSREKGLLKGWPAKGPKLLWTYKDAGLGFSSVAVVGDHLYTLGARNEEEYALCLDIAGKEPKQIWAAKLGPIFTFPMNTWGDGPRSTPTVDGDFVYVLGGQGELACLERINGKMVWRKNLIKDFGGQVMEYNEGMNWGYNESPLIDGNLLICSPGGKKGTVVALDKKTGNLKWRTTELPDQATNSSAVVAEIGGVRQYVQTTYKDGTAGGGVAGIAAADGKLLWYAPNKRLVIYNICFTPIVKGDVVYVSSGENAGCNFYQISRDAGGKFAAKDLYESKNKIRQAMQNGHGGVVLLGDHLFGCSDKRWACQDWNTGAKVWDEPLQSNSGSLTSADGHLYLLSAEGEVVLLKVDPKQWDEKGRFTISELSKTRQTRPTHQAIGVWTHPVVANGRLYVRDQELLYCYEVK